MELPPIQQIIKIALLSTSSLYILSPFIHTRTHPCRHKEQATGGRQYLCSRVYTGKGGDGVHTHRVSRGGRGAQTTGSKTALPNVYSSWHAASPVVDTRFRVSTFLPSPRSFHSPLSCYTRITVRCVITSVYSTLYRRFGGGRARIQSAPRHLHRR